MAGEEDRILEIEVSDARRFVSELLNQAGRADLAASVDHNELNHLAAQVIDEFAMALGAEISDLPGGEPRSDLIGNLGALIGRRYHIKVREVIWKSVMASAPFLISLLQAGVDSSHWPQAGVSALSLIGLVRQHLQKLEPEEVTLYLAIEALARDTGEPVTTEGIVAYLRDKTKTEDKFTGVEADKILNRMAHKNLISESIRGYRISK